jgi:hypothetical protein
MNSQPLTNSGGGERQTEVEVRSNPHTSRTPQRHDPPLIPLALPAPSGRSPYRLLVHKETGLFVLRTFHNGVEIECVKAMSAQMIQDYVRANWPVGTKVQWIIVPPFRMISHRPFPDRVALRRSANSSQ